jgi:hypothetical protein
MCCTCLGIESLEHPIWLLFTIVMEVRYAATEVHSALFSV